MGKFSGTLNAKRVRTDNHPAGRKAKAEIRLRVLDAVGRAEAGVFDAYCGAGQMHDLVWRHARAYTGCDLKWYWDERLCFAADNARVMRAIDLAGFNVFDFDAYGSPWGLCVILAARRGMREGERIGIVLTEGSGLGLNMGNVPLAMAHLSGVRSIAAGSGRWQDELIDLAIAGLARRLDAGVTKRWQADRGGGQSLMRYIGLVLDRPKP